MLVKRILRQISSLSASLDLNDAEARAKAQAEINRLQQELTNVVPESQKDHVKNVILYRVDNFSFLVMRFDYRFYISLFL